MCIELYVYVCHISVFFFCYPVCMHFISSLNGRNRKQFPNNWTIRRMNLKRLIRLKEKRIKFEFIVMHYRKTSQLWNYYLDIFNKYYVKSPNVFFIIYNGSTVFSKNARTHEKRNGDIFYFVCKAECALQHIKFSFDADSKFYVRKTNPTIFVIQHNFRVFSDPVNFCLLRADIFAVHFLMVYPAGNKRFTWENKKCSFFVQVIKEVHPLLEH